MEERCLRIAELSRMEGMSRGLQSLTTYSKQVQQLGAFPSQVLSISRTKISQLLWVPFPVFDHLKNVSMYCVTPCVCRFSSFSCTWHFVHRQICSGTCPRRIKFCNALKRKQPYSYKLPEVPSKLNFHMILGSIHSSAAICRFVSGQ